MPKLLTADQVSGYRRDGFHFPVRVLPAAEARAYRDRLEEQERALGGPLTGDMRHKVHLLFTWANELARHPKILDAVEDVIGPDILCWSTTFFTKEAHSPSFVSWHQDATYWGLSTDDVITVWVAFADAPVESGAMKFWPGSHLKKQLVHRDTFAFSNDTLWQYGVDEQGVLHISHRDKPVEFSHRCFVLARAVLQFHQFARFDLRQPRVAPARLRLTLRIRRTLLPRLAIGDTEGLHMLQPALRQIWVQRLADPADAHAGRPGMDVAIGDRQP